MRKYLQVIIFLFCINLYSQVSNLEKLQASVLENNRRGNFNKSMEQINTFISDNASDNFFLYKAYILKSYTHKGLFDYEATFKALDKAYVFGNKTKNKEEVIANVNLEKAYAYFDIAKYKEAKVLMLHLKKTNYMHIHSADIAGMLMQEAYLEYLDKNYRKAEKIYDEAIILMSKANPKNLPIIYGKKVQLYTHTKENEKLNNAFQLGLKSAKENKIIKYEVYMHEQMREKQMQNGNWKAAFYSYKKIDSLLTIYNANDKNEQLKLLEKDLEIQKKDNAIKWNKIQRNVLLIFLFVCFIAIYFGIKNHKSKLENHKLLEKENKRIHDELQLLSSNLVSQGFKEIDFSKYGLSERQLQIIELISQGKTNKEIANQIFISENTVKYHLKTIYDILGIDNRNEFFKMIKS